MKHKVLIILFLLLGSLIQCAITQGINYKENLLKHCNPNTCIFMPFLINLECGRSNYDLEQSHIADQHDFASIKTVSNLPRQIFQIINS